MNITVVGTGYVGFSLSVLLAQKHNVIALDIDEKRVNDINRNISPIEDPLITDFLNKKKLSISSTTDKEVAYKNSELVIIATPTDYDPDKNFFNTSSIESVLKDINLYNKSLDVVIKSTIPIGYVESIRKSFKKQNIIFSPEFLREGRALYDNLYPSRIIAGGKCNLSIKIVELLRDLSLNDQAETLYVGASEAEAIKLFANSYLAMRVAYFNELDTFCADKGLEASEVVNGISYDPRIGTNYNNPSFGYGGYCLPKDTKQLEANFSNIPQNLISAIVISNKTRLNFIANKIESIGFRKIGIYRLSMKSGSDNFRSSAMIELAHLLKQKNLDLTIFEPLIKEKTFMGLTIQRSFEKFVSEAELVVANRLDKKISPYQEKIFTRDIFQEN